MEANVVATYSLVVVRNAKEIQSKLSRMQSSQTSNFQSKATAETGGGGL